MANYHSKLESLHKVRVAARQAQQRRVADALRAQAALEEQVASLQYEVEAATQRHRDFRTGVIDVHQLMDIERYEAALKKQGDSLQQQITLVSTELERRYQDLSAAEQQVRVVEKLDERRRRAFEQAERRREQRELDEVATVQYVRKRGKPRSDHPEPSND